MKKNQIIGVFDSEDQLMKAIHKVKDKHIPIHEVYTPFPVFGAIEAMGKQSRFTYVAFLYGLFGALGVLAFLYYTSVIDWPMNFGGKPSAAFPSFIVITIVLTIFIVTILSLFTFSIRAKVWPGKAFSLPDVRATDDRFLLVFDSEGVADSLTELKTLLQQEGATEIIEKEVTQENVF